MAFTEDLSQFFETDDFAVEAVITLPDSSLRTVKTIFNTPSQSVEIYDTNIESDAPNLTVKTADLTGVKTRNSINVGGTDYLIEHISHDGTGVSTLFIK